MVTRRLRHLLRRSCRLKPFGQWLRALLGLLLASTLFVALLIGIRLVLQSAAISGTALASLFVLMAGVLAIEILGVSLLFLAVSAALKASSSDSKPAPVSAPLDFDTEITRKCLRLCRRSYSNPPANMTFRYVDFFWFEGGVFGMVDKTEDSRVYVAFRGTSEIGNWILTNAQAHMVKASEAFRHVAGIRGGVHQGFFKAFVALWAGGRPARARLTPIRGYLRTRWRLAPIWATLLILPLWTMQQIGLELPLLSVQPHATWAVMWLLVALGATVAQFVVSRGDLERVLGRRRALVLGPPLSRLLADSTDKEVIFTGHSLGGAMAALAFAAYQTRGPARLVTFGSPQFGDAEFLKWFKQLRSSKVHECSFCLIANRGDPVAHLPPSDLFIRAASRRLTVFGALLAAVYFLCWLPYRWCYGVAIGTEWESLVSWRGRDGLLPKEHDYR